MSDYDNNNPCGKYWATILYDDSCVSHFDNIIKDWLVPAFLIAHDPEDDTKKHHYHLMIMFPSNKRRNYVKNLFESIGGVGCEQIRDKISYARYLIHKDNPEKKQYLPTDVYCFGGANYELFLTQAIDKSAELQLACEVMSLISDNHVIFFKDLVLWAKDNNRLDIMQFCMDKTNFVYTFMRSLEYSSKSSDKYTTSSYCCVDCDA